jgi:hypothetical protein
MAMSRTSISVFVGVVVVGILFYIGKTPPKEDRESAAPAPTQTLADDGPRKDQEAEVAATKSAELERRKHVKAVAFLRAYERSDEKNGRLLEGVLTNRADFPVYSVEVCVEGTCRAAVPSTLQPSTEATFSVPLKPDRLKGNASVTWRVEPPREGRSEGSSRDD